MLHRRVALLVLLCLALGASAQAGIIVEIGSATIAAGGQASVPVYAYSDLADPAADAFAFFGLQVQITGTAAAGFTNPQPSPDPAFANTEFIFLGNSTIGDSGGTILSFVDKFQVAGGDSSLDGSLASPGGASNKRLLAFLDLKADANARPGEVFYLNVVADQTPDSPTWFSADGIARLGMSSSHPGVVTVTAVPEPSAVIRWLSLGAVGAAAAWRWRRRRAA